MSEEEIGRPNASRWTLVTSKIETLIFLLSQSEEEGSPTVDLRLGPNSSPMFHNDSLYDRQSHSGANELFLSMKPPKGSKQLVDVFHIEARAMVANHEYVRSVLLILPDFNEGRRAPR